MSIIEPLSKSINQSLETGSSQALKCVIMKPVFKHRVLQSLPKCPFASILKSYRKTYKFPNSTTLKKKRKNKSWLPTQFGFREHLNTILASKEVLNEVVGTLDGSFSTAGVLMCVPWPWYLFIFFYYLFVVYHHKCFSI